MEPSSIESANSSISAPVQKNRPVPVKTIALQVESSSKPPITPDISWIKVRVKAFLAASSERVTTATPPS